MTIDLPKLTLVPHDDKMLRYSNHMTCFFGERCLYDPKELVEAMNALMLEHNGLGLAAPQVGISISMFIVRGPIAFFNPRIVGYSNEKIVLDEGCLSFKGLALPIERSRHVRVRYEDVNGETQTSMFTGMTARCIQHESEHLGGTLFFDHVSKLKIERAIKKAKKHGGVTYRLSDIYNPNHNVAGMDLSFPPLPGEARNHDVDDFDD